MEELDEFLSFCSIGVWVFPCRFGDQGRQPRTVRREAQSKVWVFFKGDALQRAVESRPH
jgi:hypothetical protein